jgi:hypothetical protein
VTSYARNNSRPRISESQESTDILADEIKILGSIANGLLGFGE